MHKNDAFIAKIVNMRLTKISMAIFAPDERLPNSATLVWTTRTFGLLPFGQHRQTFTPQPHLRSVYCVFFCVLLTLYYDHMCSETDLHKKKCSLYRV